MKTLLTTLFILIFSLQLTAQFSEKNAIYLSLELVAGNYSGANLNLNYVFNEKISLQAGVFGYSRKAKSKPNGYSSGLLGSFLYQPREEMNGYQFLIGRVIVLNKRGTTRANLSGGLGFTKIEAPENWAYTGSNPLVPNYGYDDAKKNAVSLIINPKIEFAFTRYFGFTLSPILQINKESTFVGIGFGLVTGLLRGNKQE